MNDELKQLLDPPSKTQRKKTMIALQEVGTRLTSFRNTQLDALPLSDKLREAIEEFKRLPNSHGAKRRQLQYIGRLMRDHDLEVIEQAIAKLHQGKQESRNTHQLLDDYCSMVFSGGDSGINELLKIQNQLERQILRKLHLDYRKATDHPDPSRLIDLKKRLLKYLKENL